MRGQRCAACDSKGGDLVTSVSVCFSGGANGPECPPFFRVNTHDHDWILEIGYLWFNFIGCGLTMGFALIIQSIRGNRETAV